MVLVVCALGVGCGRFGFSEPTDAQAGDGSSEDWWDRGFSRRNRIDVLGTKLLVGETDFPLLVHLAAGFDRTMLKANGGDLRFVAADQVTQLPYEIESISATSVDVWVGIPEIRGRVVDEVIWAYYGNPSAQPTLTNEMVWSASFVGVWHLGADSRDSTSHHLDGAYTGTAMVPGVAANARDIQGGYVAIPSAPALLAIGANGTATWSAWMKPHSNPLPSFSMTVIGRQTDGGGLDDFRLGTFNGGADGQICIDPGQVDVPIGGGPVSVLERWQLLALVRDGGALRMTVNGVTVNATTRDGTIHPSTNRVLIGVDCNACATPTDDPVDGVIDEARIESVARPDHWLVAEALNVNGDLVVVQPFEP